MNAPERVVAGPVALVGLGMMGGSLARALKSLPDPPEIRAYTLERRDLDEARDRKVVDHGCADPADAVAGARILVIATPLGVEEAVLREVAGALEPETPVLDLASLQAPALGAARAAGLEERFVACHPLTGSEESGFAASRDDLFEGAPVYLSARSAAEAVRKAAEALWGALGARPIWVDADLHDTRMAVVSHLPQMVANGLARVLEEGGFTVDDLGPGGAAMTRLAASSPGMWRDLLAHSGPQVAALLRLLSRELDGWARVLDGQDLDELVRQMERTRRWRAP